ncbi:major facilitator transporter [Bifidobacterium criceti]|uniref:Major facilitator transporter n=2 Tax=Bifidobacterium criceti TaxID=1960969 RepID=A0A2A2EJE3_9BIFI|nr:major facilitator transporter [Bifidobacterium criceti]
MQPMTRGAITPEGGAAEDGAPHPHERLITRDVALIMAATFFFMGASMMGGPIIAGFAHTLGANGALMGFIAGALSLSALFCRPIAGHLSDRTSKRILAVSGGALYLMTNIWYAYASNPASLLAARIVNGVGFACISVCLSTWLSMLLPISRMGAGMGLYGTMNALAQAFGPDLGIRISQSVGYRAAFLTAAGMAVLVVVCVLFIKDGGRPYAADGGAHPRGARHHLRLSALFEPNVIPIAVIFMMFGIPYFANQSFIVDYATRTHASFGVSAFFPMYALVLLAVRIALRNWFDTKSFLFFLVLCTSADIVMILALTYLRSFWMLALAAVATAFGYGLMSSVTQAKAVVIAGKARSGMANTTYYAGIDLGMFLGPLIGGFLYGGLPITWFYPALLATMPLAWAIYLPFHRMIDGAQRT